MSRWYPCASMLRTATAVVVAAISAGQLQAVESQILETYNDTHTSYKAGATTVQGVLPHHGQRGVSVDGTLRAQPTFPWAVAGNPQGWDWNDQMTYSGIRLDMGAYMVTEVDIALPANVPWVIARSYNARQGTDATPYDSGGYQGNNWFQMSQPELIGFEGATDDKDVIYLVYGADRYIEFKRSVASGEGANEFKAKNGAAGMLLCTPGTEEEPDTYTYYDQNGWRTVFFGFDAYAEPAPGQIWKIIDPAGNTAYVGDASTASTAITSGYDGSGHLETAYDSSGRCFSYYYSNDMLISVDVEEDEAYVAIVEYTYYGSQEDHGSERDLKEVCIYMPEAGLTEIKTKYYRYWKGSYDADTNPGRAYALKYIVDFEGVRRRGSTYDTVSDANLESYASAYFEYDSSRRIDEFWMNGACGCSGGIDGHHYVEYDSNGSYSDGAGYDTAWAMRTILERPDGAYETQYFDETGQPLSHVISDADPDSASNFWVTRVQRNSDGVMTKLHTPANLSSYTHSTGAISSDSSNDLVWHFSLQGSGDMTGFKTAEKWSAGENGTQNNYLAWTYTSTSITPRTDQSPEVKVVRPLFATESNYPDAGGSAVTTTHTYTFHSATDTDVKKLAVAEAETQLPAVTTAHNGSNSSNYQYTYHDEAGDLTFAKSATGIIDYWEYDGGELVMHIEDADLTEYDDIPQGTAPTGWTNTGTPFHRKTTYSYTDDGGGSSELPDGTSPQSYTSYLLDQRIITLSYPHVDTSGTTTYYGPILCIVTNHAGKVELKAVIAVSGGSTTLDQDSHVDETDSDPLLAINPSLGTLTQVVRYRYDAAASNDGGTGTRLVAKWTYFVVPGYGNGTEGTNYDETIYSYDDMGRLSWVKEPHGTIMETVYDSIGRPSKRMLGTYNTDPLSGHYDMADVVEYFYDESGVGNSHVTRIRRDTNMAGTTYRDSNLLYDVRGRAIVETHEEYDGQQTTKVSPHRLYKYDNLGRQVAVGLYSSDSGLDATDDPTTLATNRVALSETYYDELGRTYQEKRHKVDDADGSLDDSLLTDSWYDAAGRLIKQDGEQLVKYAYDRIGRSTDQYILANCTGDSGYGDADDVTGDIVLEERETVYESKTSDDVVMEIAVERLYSDSGTGETTGELDTNSYTSSLTVDDSGFSNATYGYRRAQITAYWYDVLGRVTTEALYGTNSSTGNIADFTWTSGGAPGGSGAGVLVTTYAYHDDGLLKSTTDPNGYETRTTYNDDGKVSSRIRNYVDGTPGGGTLDDEDQTVLYGYTDGLMTTMTADLPAGETDQVTTYTYGVNEHGTEPSEIATGHLLKKVQYPDSSDGTNDVVFFAYNTQGERTYERRQIHTTETPNKIQTDYDGMGRLSHQRVTTLGTGFGGAVRRISFAYDSLGRAQTVTQYDDPTTGSVVDEVKYTYDDWGNVITFAQDHDSTVATGGNYLYDVEWVYAKATAGRNTLRRTSLTLPDGDVISYTYSSTGSLHDDEASRVSSVMNGLTTLAEYRYNGLSRCVDTDLPEPDFYRALHSGSSTFDALDQFNRLKIDRWTKDLATDIDFHDRDISRDYNSNITAIDDQLYNNWDLSYTVDNLDRLVQTDGGFEDEDWTLTQTGNWDYYKLDANDDGDYLDAGDRKEDNTFNAVNEWTDRDLDTDGDDVYDDVQYGLTYDPEGNLVDDGASYKYIYDAFGRLVELTDRSDNTVAEYRYNGLGFRISVKYDTDADGDVDGNDLTYHHVYDDQWRIVATFRSSDSDPKEQFVHHNASLGGRGGCNQNIDLLICRDKDKNTAWTAQSDGTLEDRNYFCQNYRGDVASVHKASGAILERVHYSSYGVPFLCIAGDTDQDGDVDQSDLGNVQSGYNVRWDFDLDGAVGQPELGIVLASYGFSYGRGMLSSSSVQNFFGYAGYRHDEVVDVMCHVRHRVYLTEYGRWTSRDPLGYVDGMGLYEYARSTPLIRVDPRGLAAISGPTLPKGQDCVGTSRYLNECLDCCTTTDENGNQTTDLECAEACRRRFRDPRKIPSRNPDDWGPYGFPGFEPPWFPGHCWRYAICNPAWLGPPFETIRLSPPGWVPGDGCGEMMKDLHEIPGVEKPDENGNCPPGTYGIAVLAKTTSPCDYHFYREECDGNWTDKPGDREPRGPFADPEEENERRRREEPGPNYDYCGIICYPFN